uniref:Uncharacterized protein n=1 Tax=Picea glauca TaxID=3330 RepID=A0A101LYX8_PICGL|nr:hypothetical protein ABT39_MTgene1461 [Picea glauca]KUM47908.1 hypothetical protein ABT39_MTgene4903 [Picea glauca]KUM47921.1 hypothetical protein ABT39_MTgene4916 [Picea glauca]QHR92437.1 hypothetical protein Q903MT_gene6483 [Picea sitchensis]
MMLSQEVILNPSSKCFQFRWWAATYITHSLACCLWCLSNPSPLPFQFIVPARACLPRQFIVPPAEQTVSPGSISSLSVGCRS